MSASAASSMALAANISLGLSAASTGLQVMATMQQGKAQRAQAAYQAQVDRNNQTVAKWQAQDAIDRGKIERQEHAIKVSLLTGRAQAVLGASGTDVTQDGAPTLLADIAETGNLEERIIESNAEREAFGYEVNAMNYGASAALNESRASRSNTLETVGALFGGASSVANKWFSYRQATTMYGGGQTGPTVAQGGGFS